MVFVALLSCLLSACVAGLVVYDKRNIATIQQDGQLAHRIQMAVSKYLVAQDARVQVISFNQTVLLTGQTPTQDLKMAVQRLATQTVGVGRVYNELSINHPIALSQRSMDTVMNAQIRSQMLATKGLASGSIRVVTENGIAYLLGSVSKNQADLAVSVARSVPGVEKVVKMFQYIA